MMNRKEQILKQIKQKTSCLSRIKDFILCKDKEAIKKKIEDLRLSLKIHDIQLKHSNQFHQHHHHNDKDTPKSG